MCKRIYTGGYEGSYRPSAVTFSAARYSETPRSLPFTKVDQERHYTRENVRNRSEIDAR